MDIKCIGLVFSVMRLIARTRRSSQNPGRSRMLTFFARLEPCLIGIEACGSSHYWARELTRLGHTVRIIPPQFVRPYLK